MKIEIEREEFQRVYSVDLPQHDMEFLYSVTRKKELGCDIIVCDADDEMNTWWIHVGTLDREVKAKSWPYHGYPPAKKQMLRLYKLVKQIEGLEIDGWLLIEGEGA